MSGALCVQGRIKHRRLQAHPHLDPANDTSLDPAPDLLAALAVSPQRAEPLMFLSWHAEWLRDHWCPRCAPVLACQRALHGQHCSLALMGWVSAAHVACNALVSLVSDG